MSRQCHDCGVSGECICFGPGAERAAAQEAAAESVSPMVLDVCEPCRDGQGGECHTPGCAFWMKAAPDVPLTAVLTRDEMIAAGAIAVARGVRPVDAVDRQHAEAVLLAAGAITHLNFTTADPLPAGGDAPGPDDRSGSGLDASISPGRRGRELSEQAARGGA